MAAQADPVAGAAEMVYAAASACPLAHASAAARADDLERRRALRCAVNRVRAVHGLRRLRVNRRLRVAAQRHAQDMHDRGYFAHTAPDGGDLVDRVTDAGWLTRRTVDWRVAEVLASGCASASTPWAAVEGWLHSPGHRTVILSHRFRRAGIGLVDAPRCDGASTWVLVAGKKRSR